MKCEVIGGEGIPNWKSLLKTLRTRVPYVGVKFSFAADSKTATKSEEKTNRALNHIFNSINNALYIVERR